MNSLLLLSNLALILGSSACLMACLRVRGKCAHLLGLYVVAYAQVVIILELSGLLGVIIPAVVLSFQFLLTAIAATIWVRTGRPSLLGPFAAMQPKQILDRSAFVSALRSPVLVISILALAGSVIYVYFLSARLILTVPPNNYDSLTYHLARVGYWLQYRSFYPWPTPNVRQTAVPMNAELGLLWTILWWGTDQLAGFVQWITVPAIMVGVYGLARMLGGARGASTLTALLWPTLPQVLNQSWSTQNDLVTASFWVAALFFLFAGLRRGSKAETYLSGMALGLAIGAKRTSLLVLPGLALACLVMLWLYRKEKVLKPLALRWTAACTLGVLLLGSYIYIQNVIAFRRLEVPLYSSQGLARFNTVRLDDASLAAKLRLMGDNTGRYIYQLVDLSPLPLQLASQLNPFKAAFFSRIYGWLHIYVENRATIGRDIHGFPYAFDLNYINPAGEDGSWFGPLAALLIPTVAYQAYRGLRGGDALRITLAIMGISFLALNSVAREWDPAAGRYFMIAVALCFPLLSSFFNADSIERSVLAAFLVLVGLSVMFTVTLGNADLKNMARKQILPIRRADPKWANEYNFRMVMQNVPADASVGLASYEDFPDYAFFGERFTRRVNLAPPVDPAVLPRVDIEAFGDAFRHSDYIFAVGGRRSTIPELISGEFDELSDDGRNSLWIRKDLRSTNTCDGDRWPFTDFFQSSQDAVCPQFPIVPGYTRDEISHTIVLQQGHFSPEIAAGGQARLEFGLLAKEPAEVKLSIKLAPEKTKTSQTVRLLLSGANSESQVFNATFDSMQTLSFVMPLQPDTYRVQIGLTHGAMSARILEIQVTNP